MERRLPFVRRMKEGYRRKRDPLAAEVRPSVVPGAAAYGPNAWWRVFRKQIQFAFNKAIHFRISHILEGTRVEHVEIGTNGMEHRICISRHGTPIGVMDYFAAVDESGIRRGGHVPSSYLHDLVRDDTATEAQRLRIVRQLIARLPGAVMFGLTAGPYARDVDILKKAFAGAGFRIWPQTTFVYAPPIDGSDLVASMKGSRIKSMLRAARRDLEVIEIPPAEFVRFFVSNLEAADKQNYCSPAIDLALLSDAVGRNPPQARLVAARRRARQALPQSTAYGIDSAIALTWGADGLVKLFRITYDRRGHQHATKLLILEGGATASRLGKRLDTDAATQGGSELYRRFGSFTEHTRHEFVRYPMRWYVQQRYPRLARWLGLAGKPAGPGI